VGQLEAYRHRHGLGPADAASPGHAGPAERALGPRPSAPAGALAWDLTLDTVTTTALAPELAP
jgi:hypothetical protein